MSQAEPGMTLAMPVYHPEQMSTVLLRAGARLERRSVDRMREMRVPQVWIEYPSLSMISRFVSPGVMQSRAVVSNEVCTALDAASSDAHARLDFPSYKSAMGGLMQKLVYNSESAIFVGELVDAGQPAVRHGANVGFISLLMGLRLGFYLIRERKHTSGTVAKDVTSLGVAAMLHDVGMTRLPAAVLARWRETRDESDPDWRQHVKVGYEMVRGQIEPSAAASVLHHHQRFDGSGFPKRKTLQGDRVPIAGEDIHIYARIIAAADLYDRAVNPASDPGDDETDMPGVPPVVALSRFVRGDQRTSIDPVVLRALLSVCPAYAPGTQVRLSNGVDGVVTDWSPLDPCRPVVHQINGVDDELGDRYDLRSETDLSVMETEGIPVTEANFYPETPQEFDLMHVEKAMINGAVAPGQAGTDEPGAAAQLRPSA
ncbi:MAG: HD domain-containing phosphohydrolase [Planctomycetota bacterium]